MHTKGHIRDAFCAAVEEERILLQDDLSLETPVTLEKGYVPHRVPLRELLGLLWNSTDVLPGDIRTELDDARRWDDQVGSYGQAAQRLRHELG